MRSENHAQLDADAQLDAEITSILDGTSSSVLMQWEGRCFVPREGRCFVPWEGREATPLVVELSGSSARIACEPALSPYVAAPS
eukprot:1101145-Prymnesium_polylepis.1